MKHYDPPIKHYQTALTTIDQHENPMELPGTTDLRAALKRRLVPSANADWMRACAEAEM